MSHKVIPIHQAKTQLSQLVKEAQAGQTIYIGAYGQPQAILSPVPTKKPIIFGILKDDPRVKDIDFDAFNQADQEIADLFENSDLHLGPEGDIIS